MSQGCCTLEYMAPLPVIANTYRCTLQGNVDAGVAPVNVIHIRASSSSEADVGAAIWDSFISAGYLFGPVPNTFGLTSITVLPLDGTSASLTLTAPEDWDPADHYTDAGDWIPEACGIVSVRTNVRGPRGRGRIFLGPVAEGVQAKGFIGPDVAAATENAWLQFLADMLSNDMEWVVASYAHAEANGITQVIGRTGIGTQRRRLLQQR